jgi:hypothetical protein
MSVILPSLPLLLLPSLLLLLQVRSGLRHLTLAALAEATPLGQRATALREASKVSTSVDIRHSGCL